MQLNNTSKYAIRIMGYISSKDEQPLFSAKEIASILNIPYKFLTKIMNELVKADFLLSIRGREGGYKLSRPASTITVMDILKLYHEFDDHKHCILGIGKCDSKSKCSLHDKWVEPKSMIEKMFEETTLDKFDSAKFKI